MPEVIFNGPEGRLEGRYQPGKQPNAPMALILHPHPEHGGTMNNKVVYTMYHVFVKRGFSVLRFNFRGVGRSALETAANNLVSKIDEIAEAAGFTHRGYNEHDKRLLDLLRSMTIDWLEAVGPRFA